MMKNNPDHDFGDLIDAATRVAGSQSLLADLLGVKQQNVSYWRRNGVPVEYCAAFEVASAGAVTRQDLRPDDWQKIWPELAQSPAATPAPAAEGQGA